MMASTRRTTFVLIIVGFALAAVAALAITALAPVGAKNMLVGVAVVMALLLLVGVLVLVLAPRGAPAPRPKTKMRRVPVEEPPEEDEEEGEDLLLRCASCREVFAVRDDGRRPLRHTCPHCGRTGVLKDNAGRKPPAQGPGYGR